MLENLQQVPNPEAHSPSETPPLLEHSAAVKQVPMSPESDVHSELETSGTILGLSHSYWRTLILHELVLEFWSVLMVNLAGKFVMGV